MGLGIPLEQLVPLLLHPGGLLRVLPCPCRQILEHPRGILRVPAGLGFPPSKIVRLRHEGSQLGHPLAELGSHVPMQPCLIDEAVPLFLVFTKEPRFLPATSDKRLKKTGGQKIKVDEERRNREVRPNKYLAGGNDNVSKGTLGMV